MVASRHERHRGFWGTRMREQAELSAEQEAAAGCDPGGGHVLVVARPGSGKTHTLVARARYLIDAGIAPERLLAMTFSRRAAVVLQDRLGSSGIQAGTFHAICADLLEKDGAAIGIRPPLRIVDEGRGRDYLLRAIAQTGLPVPGDDRTRNALLVGLAGRIERRKRRGLEEHRPGPGRGVVSDLDPEEVTRIDECYCRLLREANAFDFADQVVEAVRLLREDEATAERRRGGVRSLLVDEFHDISPEQYELVRLLGLPRGEAQVFVVGDLDQAIYGWRDAAAPEHFRRYRSEYRPVSFELTTNYRSRTPIVHAADRCISGAGRTRPSQPHRPGGVMPVWCRLPDAEAEAHTIVSLIKQAVASGKVPGYGSFAVLYRDHRVPDTIEAELIRAGIPLWRVQPGRFFDTEDAQDSLRYLELAYYLADAEFEPAMNWPRAVVDEITMAHLRRLADRRGTRLADLIRSGHALGRAISPLTRRAMRDVVATVDRDLRPLVGRPMRDALAPFLSILAARRCPTPIERRTELRDTCDVLERLLHPLLAPLRDAITGERPLAVRVGEGADPAAAEVLLQYVMRNYFDRDVACYDTILPPLDPFVVSLGCGDGVVEEGIAVSAVATRTVTFSLTTCVWRLLQMLLMSGDDLERGEFVLLDIETSNGHPQHAELIEYAALPFVDGGVAGAGISSLVRPSGASAIDPRASDVHGLLWRDMRDAPHPRDCLPRLFEMLDGVVVVGHNMEGFDLPVLRRSAQRAECTVGPVYVVDTRRMAQRLWPDEASYRLEDLTRRTHPEARQRHRAHDDCLLTGHLFAELITASRRDRELDVLTEALPLVAVSVVCSGCDVVNDNVLLADLGARALAFGIGETLISAWTAATDADTAETACRAIMERRAVAPEDDERWARMEAGWRSAVDAFELAEPGGGVGEFLRYVALAQPIDALPRATEGDELASAATAGREERVQLMTVHSAKGLEWDIVFLAGVEDDRFPHYRAASAEELAEERRVFYVGMTRARDRLFLFTAETRHGRHKACSRFLTPLLGTAVEVRGAASTAPAVTSRQPAGRTG